MIPGPSGVSLALIRSQTPTRAGGNADSSDRIRPTLRGVLARTRFRSGMTQLHTQADRLPSPGARSIWVTDRRWFPTIGIGSSLPSEPGTRVQADKRAGSRSGSSPWGGAGDRWPYRGLMIWRRVTNRRRRLR